MTDLNTTTTMECRSMNKIRRRRLQFSPSCFVFVGFLVCYSFFSTYSQQPLEQRQQQQQQQQRQRQVRNAKDVPKQQEAVSSSVEVSAGKFAKAASTTNKKATAVMKKTPNNSKALARTLESTPIGRLGPAGTNRVKLTYYDSLFYLAMQYGKNAKSLLDVGCANDPFAKYLAWIDELTCVAPYFINYNGNNLKQKMAGGVLAATSTGGDDEGRTSFGEVNFVQADFMEYNATKQYDVVICSQVVEHVPDPAAFTKKLIETAKVAAIISVPHKWPSCNPRCSHLSDHITKETVMKWAAPYYPKQISIISEGKPGGAYDERIVAVFNPMLKK